ncbi:molybdopterin molybdotransferase MoeA [Thalassotalea agarivorans]|uniref:Molybdopterin molybdenumtransferase n=1 Tax=Thalassotalea agarivorans TaxID=349064 RepID=A0A1I0APW3_THASX|nr:gephyrin-like molybdotransferase Glp [Thalassotalea agarivorans]SES96454.1 molybdopterin molybdochelatase [Thalassotalea agarivorans]
MSICDTENGLMSFEQAVNYLIDAMPTPSETQQIAIEDALGRVLAKDVVSSMNVPSADNSAMDGYAFAFDAMLDNSQTLTLVGQSFAGAPFNGSVASGECVRIMTGAVVPDGCDTVQMQENAQVVSEQLVTIEKPKYMGANVRNKGEDISQGQVIFAAGRKLSSADIGVLVSLGFAHIDVFKQLTVALVATGDELKRPGESLKSGDIYETNSYVVTSMLKKLGVNILNFGIVADDLAAITSAFNSANEQADIVISSGGVSVGEADYTKQVLAELGSVDFWKVAIKPGKPFAFGQLSDSIFFGLPGNPVSATVTFYQLVVPALTQMQGAKWSPRKQMRATLTANIRKRPGRKDFQRGIYTTNENGEVSVSTTGAQGSGMLTSMSVANCFIVLPAEQGSLFEGEQVLIEPFDALLT